jgi:hypothetical protein
MVFEWNNPYPNYENKRHKNIFWIIEIFLFTAMLVSGAIFLTALIFNKSGA